MSMNSFHARQTRAHPKPDPKPDPAPQCASNLSRVDVLLVQSGLASSRTEAQDFIKAGRVSWAGGVITKPAHALPAGTQLILAASEENHYVSRGGLKLAGALKTSGLSVARRVCLDIGQSTGGFTDCLLQAGALRVVGVDVGHGQLHPRLRTDERVTAFEGINCRTLSAADLKSAMPDGGFDLIVADVSFISLTLILPCLPALLSSNGDMLLLAKPQFEADGPEHVGKGGIVRDPDRHDKTEKKLRTCAQNLRLKVYDWFNSPIAGSDGNREFFIWMSHDRAFH